MFVTVRVIWGAFWQTHRRLSRASQQGKASVCLEIHKGTLDLIKSDFDLLVKLSKLPSTITQLGLVVRHTKSVGGSKLDFFQI